ncbi:MAG: peptidase dimerization domain-containing protein, partial [Gemmatimonadota bacterium]
MVINGLAGHASAPDRARNALDGVGPVLAAIRSLPAARLSGEDPILGRSTMAATDIRVAPATRNVIPDRVVIGVDWRILPGVDADTGLALVRDHLESSLTLPEGLAWDVGFTVERQTTWTGREADREMFGAGFLLDP